MFSADVAGAEAQTEEEIALEEESLYQEYLAARAKQANSTADDTARLAATLPASSARLKEAEDAKAVAERAQAELEVQTTRVVKSITEIKHAKVEPPAAPAVIQTANVESAPPTPNAPAPTPPVQTTVPADTTQTQVPKPTGEPKQSWLISGAESDAQSDAPTQPPAITTPAKPATNARPTPTATNVDAATMSAAERAKKLEQRLKAVQARRDSKTAAMGANATSKIDTNSAAVKPNPDSTSVALDTKSAQPQTVDKTTTPEPKKVNGSDTVPPASDTIEVPAAKDVVRTPSTTGTAKADLEAALQALNTKEPETNPTIPTPTESGNGADQTDAVPQELLDPNARAPLGDLTQNGGLGCTKKECPNCTALVPMDADGCGCGFAFPTKNDAMPSLSLTDSDVEALQKRKKSSGISHLG